MEHACPCSQQRIATVETASYYDMPPHTPGCMPATMTCPRTHRHATPEERLLSVRLRKATFVVSNLLMSSPHTSPLQIWCMVKPKQAYAEITEAQKWVTFALTWIYMLSQQVWVIFLVILYCSRLGNMKLGQPDDEPEFSAASWFMMMFSAGIGIGLFFFGVAEPVGHYEPCASSGDFAGVGSACHGNRYWCHSHA